MKKNHLDYLIERYCATINDNKKQLKKIINHMNLEKSIDISDLDTVLNCSAQNLVLKWKNHQKTLRTEIICDVIPSYPNNILEKSLLLDAMINLLDDMYDELLTKEAMTLYVIEVLRLLALFSRQNLSKLQRKKVSDYFTKILYIALLESIYTDKIQMTSNSAEKLNYAIECYDSKGMDLDIFIELPLLELGVNPKIIQNIVSFGNIYRALSIILKDIDDLEHDVTNNIKTPIVLLSQDSKDVFKDYIHAFLEHYEKKSKKLQSKTETQLESEIINNIQEAIQSIVHKYKKTQKNSEH